MIFNLPQFDGKHVVFIGKDREWASFEKFIQANAQVLSLKSIFINDPDAEGYIDQLKALDFETATVVKTAGFPGSRLPIPYTTPTKIFFECARQITGVKIIGVTGTKGKSTVSSMIAAILKNAGKPALLGGNIGIPMLDLLAQANENSIFVLELSSFQLAELETSPDIAVITNLYRDHIDYHGSLEKYWEAKRNILRYMDDHGTIVFNPQTEMVLHWLAESSAKQLPINPEEPVDMTQSQLIGDHNRLNYLMARTAALELGADMFACKSTLKGFEPIRHRLEKVREVRGITFIDDAIATQPESAIAGITASVREVKPVGCVMLGGQDRGYDYTELVKLLSTLLIPSLVLFPDTADKIKALFPENYKPKILETADMAEAVNWAAENCPSGSVCLLSTAAPSFSVWKDFEEKGDLFQKAVLNLSN